MIQRQDADTEDIDTGYSAELSQQMINKLFYFHSGQNTSPLSIHLCWEGSLSWVWEIQTEVCNPLQAGHTYSH